MCGVLALLGGEKGLPAVARLSAPSSPSVSGQGHSPSPGQELRSRALPLRHLTRVNQYPLILLEGYFFSAQLSLETLTRIKSSSQNGEFWLGDQRTVITDRSKRGVVVSILHPSGSSGLKINPINYYHHHPHPFPAHGQRRRKARRPRSSSFLLIYLMVLRAMFGGGRTRKS